MVGFFLVFGALGVSLYNNALAMYFYFSVQATDPSTADTNHHNDENKKPRQPEDVVGCTEMMTNLMCWLIPAAFAGLGAGMKLFHFDPNVDMCVLYQESCDADGTCVDDSIAVILQNVFLWILVASFAFNLLLFAKMQYQVQQATKLSRITAQRLARDEMDLDAAEEQEEIVQKLAAVSTQCSLYTLSFFSSFVWLIVLMFIPGDKNSNLTYAFQLTAALFYPMLGISNCIIYIRPRVQMLQIMYPQDPFVVVMRVAMSKAGDPEEIEIVREEIYGSEYSGGSEAHDGSLDEASRDSAIPSVVHFDPNEKPLSIKSLVSAPDDDDDHDTHGSFTPMSQIKESESSREIASSK
jgi:hypothetical protein